MIGGIVLTTEEFQSIVLKELGEIKTDIVGIKTDVTSLKEDVSVLKEGQIRLEEGQTKLEENQLSLEKKVDAIYEQTAILSEFREDTNTLLELVMKNQARTEIATAENWSDIAKIKSYNSLI